MYQRILMPYDGSTAAQQALQEAIRLAKDQHARLKEGARILIPFTGSR